MAPEDFFAAIKEGAIANWSNYSILPSIVAAQAAHESGYADSALTQETYNLFGIKADGTCDPEVENKEPYDRTYESWDGPAACYWTTEQDNQGNSSDVYAPFRVYESYSDSLNDHGEFLNSNERYSAIIGETDYTVVAQELQNAGYATDVNYASYLIGIIEDYQLQEWDEEALENETPDTAGNFLIALGHGPDRNGNYDQGGSGNGETEAGWLRGDFLTSMKNYADNASATIEFYEENLYENREADTIEGYDAIVELHMDAVEDPSVKGGHLIIYEEDTPDDLDQRLRDLVNKHFGISPAYQETDGFSYRGENNNNVYNVTTLYSRGITNSYVELCFITNQENMDYFKTNYDEVASDIIEVISGSEITTPPSNPDPDPEPNPEPVITPISDIQTWLNETYAAGLEIDNSYGPLTVSAVIRGVQMELNSQFGANISVDGSFGPRTQAAWVPVRYGANGNLTRLIQAQLIGLGYNVNGFDGNFGPGLLAAVQAFQSDYGLAVDGRVGPATSYSLFNALEGADNSEPSTPTLTHEIQQWLNQTYNTGIEVDGSFGPATNRAVIMGVQTELNSQLGANIAVDGSYGPATQQAWDTVRYGSNGNLTRLIQAKLIGLGYDVNGFDGNFGPGLLAAVQAFQSDYGLAVDGRVGPATAYTLFNQ